jgi:uncharacterized SAM-binding protein YcdF (DUF218 family)
MFKQLRSSLLPAVLALVTGLMVSALVHTVSFNPPQLTVVVLVTVAVFLLLRQTFTRLLLTLLLPVLLALFTITFTPLLHVVLEAMTVRAAPTRADAIVILGGGLSCKTGVLEPLTQERLEQGIRLWQAGYAPTLVLSRQADALYGAACPKESDMAFRILEQRFRGHMPLVETLQNVMDTHDETVETARLMTGHGWRNVLLVTSSWHSRRASMMFVKAGIPFTSVPANAVPGVSGFVPSAGERRIVLHELGSYLKAWTRGEI